MKEKLTIIAVVVMFLVSGASLSGCTNTGSQKMMDNSMSTPAKSMEKDAMHEAMPGSMDVSKEKTMETEHMKSDMTSPMK